MIRWPGGSTRPTAWSSSITFTFRGRTCFAYENLESSRGLFHETPAHVLGNYQAHVRLLSKLRFILGVTRKVAEMNGIAQVPAVRDMLADLCIRVAMLEGLLAAETDITEAWPNGYIAPDRQTMYATMDWTMRDYPDFVQVVRELLGSHPFQQPADVSVFDNPETREMYSTFVMAEAEDAVERYKLMRLVWDLVGSEFASRHIQYEMFYNGPRHVDRTRASHYFRWGRGRRGRPTGARRDGRIRRTGREAGARQVDGTRVNKSWMACRATALVARSASFGSPHSSGVEHSLGKGEVESSNLSEGTIIFQ